MPFLANGRMNEWVNERDMPEAKKRGEGGRGMYIANAAVQLAKPVWVRVQLNGLCQQKKKKKKGGGLCEGKERSWEGRRRE